MGDFRTTAGFGIELHFKPAPRRHHAWDGWHSGARAVVFAKSPIGFDPIPFFDAIKLVPNSTTGVLEAPPSWDYIPSPPQSHTDYVKTLSKKPADESEAQARTRQDKLAELKEQLSKA